MRRLPAPDFYCALRPSHAQYPDYHLARPSAAFQGAPLQIRIKHYCFAISEPYAEGHSLTAAEAQALNSLRAENIRNNMSKVVDEAIAVLPENTMLAVETIADLQRKIEGYDRGYKIVLKHKPRAKPDPISAEAIAIATDYLLVHLRQNREEFSEEDFDSQIEVLVTYDWVQKKARERVAIRQAISTSAIEELL